MPRRNGLPPFERGDAIVCVVDWYSTIRKDVVVRVYGMRRARQFPHRWVVEIDMGYAINCYYASNFNLYYKRIPPQYNLPFDEEPQQRTTKMPDVDYLYSEGPKPEPAHKDRGARVRFYALMLPNNPNKDIHLNILEGFHGTKPRVLLAAVSLEELEHQIGDFDSGKGSPSIWAVFDLQGVLEGAYRYVMKDAT